MGDVVFACLVIVKGHKVQRVFIRMSCHVVRSRRSSTQRVCECLFLYFAMLGFATFRVFFGAMPKVKQLLGLDATCTGAQCVGQL